MIRRRLGMPLAACLAACLAASLAAAAPAPPAAPPGPAAGSFEARILAAHNQYRAAIGVPPLRWEPRLAADARRYGAQMAASGQLVHSPRASRPGQRENLWMGRAGSHSAEAMIANWAQERSFFRAGIFPNISTTGDPTAVSHYAQIIWPATTHVGCAVNRARGRDYLVCRYSPPGNIDGQRVG